MSRLKELNIVSDVSPSDTQVKEAGKIADIIVNVFELRVSVSANSNQTVKKSFSLIYRTGKVKLRLNAFKIAISDHTPHGTVSPMVVFYMIDDTAARTRAIKKTVMLSQYINPFHP